MNIKRTGMSSDEFCEYALEKHQLAFIPGDAFGGMWTGVRKDILRRVYG